MYMTLKERQTLFLYVSNRRLGMTHGKPLDDEAHTVVRYNWDMGDDYFDSVLRHARAHRRHVTIPFNALTTVDTIKGCTQMVIWSEGIQRGDMCIVGIIHDAGTGEPPETRTYSMPEEFVWDWQRKPNSRWVQLDQVRATKNFPFHDYTKDVFRDGKRYRLPLDEVLPQSRMTTVVALRNLPESEPAGKTDGKPAKKPESEQAGEQEQ